MGSAFAFESSGKFKSPSPDDLLQADDGTAIITFTRFKLADGRPYFAYMAVKPSCYAAFYAMTKGTNPMVLSNYGTLLAEGFTIDPSPELVREMRERFGFDEHYEEKLLHEARTQQRSFLKGKEEKRLGDIVAMLKQTGGSGSGSGTNAH